MRNEIVNRIDFSSSVTPLGASYAGYFPASGSRWTHLSCQWSAPAVDVEQREHRERSIGILGHATIACLCKSPETLETKERMLHFGAHTGFAPIGFFVLLAQWPVTVCTLVGEVARLRGNRLERILLSVVGRVTIQPGLLACEQLVQLLAVMHVGRGHAGAVHQPALAVHADVHLHTEVPLVALLGLMHFRIASLVLVLGGAGRCNDGGVHNGTARELQPVRLQQLAYLGKQGGTDVVLLQQVTKAEQRGGIGHALSPQVDSTEFAKGGNVVQGVLASLVGQVEPVSDQVHAQHPLKTDRRSAIAHARIVRFDQGAELAPWDQRFHTRQKCRTSRSLAMKLKSVCPCTHRQRHLSHRLSSSYALTLSAITHEGHVSRTYSVFP